MAAVATANAESLACGSSRLIGYPQLVEIRGNLVLKNRAQQNSQQQFKSHHWL